MDQQAPTAANNLPDTSGESARPSLLMLLDGLLFIADEPVTVGRLAEALEATRDEVEAALAVLQDACAERGVRLQRDGLPDHSTESDASSRLPDHGRGGRVQLVSAPEVAPFIERFLGLELHSNLSPAALETLTIVAYQQPVTRAQAEAVRGVNSDSVLRTLVSKGLIEELGRLDSVGRPIIYGTTFAFLQFFGLESLDDLPPLDL